ncbi:MAG TPA: tetratricopeptide repeat protein [Spirochaetia bacterium]|nr:tetratricopeptide repeat protein [Spirochaetia bacterium]
MGESRFLPVLMVLFLSAGMLAAETTGADASRAEADSWLERARAAFAAGSITQTADLLAPALQLSPDYSEALYLRARVELSTQEGTPAGVQDLRRALSSDTWNGTDPAAARQDLAEVLVRTGRIAEARTLLEALASRDASDPRTFILLARLQARSGDTASLRRTLFDASSQFPLVDDFAFMTSALLVQEGRRADARRVIATQIKVHPDNPALVLRAAQLEPGAAAKLAQVEQYGQQGGKDPLAAVIALEAPSRDQQKYLSQFIDQGGLSHEELLERVAAVARGTPRLRDALQSALAGFSGNRDLDSNGDGFYEERWTFSSGSAASWVRDAAEDGVPEYSATLQNGAPTSVTWRPDPRTEITLSYSAYPAAESARQSVVRPADGSMVPPAGGSTSFLLVPYSVTVPIMLSSAPKGFAPRVSSSLRLPSLEALRRSSWRIEELGPDGALLRRIDLLAGKRVYMEEDTKGSGKIDHKLWYSNGQPARGARDLNGSGRFDVEETWSNGQLVSITADTNDDGKVDYRERFGASPMKSWDFNGDGIVDSREYPAGNGRVVRDFSTAMNGTFDLSLIWEGDRLVGVRRNGQDVPVNRDSGRGIVWIGPAGAPSAALSGESAEGFVMAGGKEYLVFRHAGVTYAEELP